MSDFARLGGIVTPKNNNSTLLTLFATVISSSQINLSWNNGLYTSYVLQRADNVNFTTNLVTLYSGTALSYQNSGLAKNFTYYYRIRGILNGVASQWFTTSAQTFSSDLLLGQNLYTFGDSYTVGQAASPISNSYAELLKTFASATRLDYAAGGKGIYYVASIANALINPNNVGIYTCMIGLNDYRRSGANVRTDEKIRGGHRVFLMNAIGKNFYQANTFAQTGSWTNIGAGTFGNKYAVPNNSTGAGTLTATISGRNFGIAFLGSAGGTYTFGNLTITVDGITVFNSSMNNKTDGISDGAYDNQVTPYGIFVTGLAPGNHTFVFTSTIQTPIDYIVELPDPATEFCNTVLVGRPCKLPAAGYAVAPANANDAILDAGATVIQNVVNELAGVGYPVVYINTDVLVLDTTSGDFEAIDPVHPTNQGHNKLFQAFKNNLNFSTQDLIFNTLNQCVFFNGSYVSRGKNTWDATGASNYFLPQNTNGYVEFTVPNLTDSDFGMVGFNTIKELTNYPNYEYAVAYYNGSIYRLLNGAGFTVVQAGPLAVNSKIRIERATGVIKIRYASNGVNFVDVHTFGTDNQRFFLNLNMDASPKKLYGLNLSGFLKQSTFWNGNGSTYTNGANIFGTPNFNEGLSVSSLVTNGLVTTNGGNGNLGVTTQVPTVWLQGDVGNQINVSSFKNVDGNSNSIHQFVGRHIQGYTGTLISVNITNGSAFFAALANGCLVTVTAILHGKQTSGTPGATGFFFELRRSFLKSAGAFTAIAAQAVIASANNTGDAFTTSPIISFNGNDVVLNMAITTTKTFTYTVVCRIEVTQP